MMLRTALVLIALLACPLGSHAQYVFQTIDPFPGAKNPVITGHTLAGELRGTYRDAVGFTHTFARACDGSVHVLPLLTTRSQTPDGAVGWYTAPTGRRTGWVFRDHTFTALEPPRDAQGRFPIFSEAIHANATAVLGTVKSADGVTHAFRYTLSTRTYITFDVPGASSTAGVWISADGRLLLQAIVGDTTQYVLWEFGTFTTLAPPDLGALELVAFHEAQLIGNVGNRGVVITDDSAEWFDIPDSLSTHLFSRLADGSLVGRYTNLMNVVHGFVARPQDAPDPCPSAP